MVLAYFEWQYFSVQSQNNNLKRSFLIALKSGNKLDCKAGNMENRKIRAFLWFAYWFLSEKKKKKSLGAILIFSPILCIQDRGLFHL